MAEFDIYRCLICKEEYEEVQNKKEEAPGRRIHWEVADSLKGPMKFAAKKCMGLLLYVRSEIRHGPQATVPDLGGLAASYWNRLKLPKPGMICAARLKSDSTMVRYGKTQKAPAKNHMAGGLGSELPPSASVQEWTSDNCAEVHAAHKILSDTGLQFGKTGGMTFYSIDSQGGYRPPCLNCQKWIHRI